MGGATYVVIVGTPCAGRYCLHCGRNLASSCNKDEVSSNCPLDAVQRLTHHQQGLMLFSMSPLAAAAAAAATARITTMREVMNIFIEALI